MYMFLQGGIKIETMHRVGMYIRLSREDEDKTNETESESITNQRSFILDYIKENNYILYDEYIDDGYSGTTFDRPAFKRMIEDIETKKINTVITKDMSRLGRDYVNFGHYIEKYFPEHNVRYIAITDDVDTFVDSVGNDMVPFKAIFNDMYAKDISKKIKASIVTKKKNGCFMGTHAPYGYQKDPNNKHLLIIDPVTSIVVKRIYKMYIDGVGVRAIGRALTKELIPKPSIYKKMTSSHSFNSETKDIWDKKTISTILRNPNYTGNLYQNRRKKINYKSKKVVDVPEKDWIVSDNTHEPIIDMETFKIVKGINEKNKLIHKKSKEKNILLQGFMKCKECGHTIGINTSSKDNKRNYTICNYYRKHSKYNFCTSHGMRYENIENIVLADVKRMCKKNIDTNRLKDIANNSNKKSKEIEEIDNRIFQYKKNIESNTDYIHNTYMDKLKGIISLEMYQDVADKLSEEMATNKKIVEELENKKEQMTNTNLYTNKQHEEIIKDYLALKKPDRNLLANIIDKITIDEDRNIEIYYKIKVI